MLQKPIPQSQVILVGCPLIILAEISFVSTRLPHYALMLHPFMAMLAAVVLNWLGKSYQDKSSAQWLPRSLSYAFGGLGCLLFLAEITLHIGIKPSGSEEVEIRKYAAVAIGLGLSWLTSLLVCISRHKTFLPARYWLASLLLGPWLGLAVAGYTGLLGNYNPDVEVLLQQPAIAAILQTHPVNFVVQQTQVLTTGGDRTLLLLTFYTPHLGQRYKNISELPGSNYAWASPEPVVRSSSNYRHLSTFQG